MHAFARETRLSETSFVQSPTVDGADYRNRIWTVAAEAPFAGHPSLGVAAAVARARGDESATYTQQTHAGLQPIDVEIAGDGVYHASMLQEPAEYGPELDPSDVLGAVGLSEDDRDPELPCQAVSTGAYHVLAPVRDETVLVRAVARLRPHLRAARALRRRALPLRRRRRPRGRQRPRALVRDARRDRRGPRHRLRRRPALRLPRRARRHPRGDRHAGRRDGPRVAAGLRARGRPRARRRRRRRRARTAPSCWTPDRNPPAGLDEPRRAADLWVRPTLPRNGGRWEARLALSRRGA